MQYVIGTFSAEEIAAKIETITDGANLLIVTDSNVAPLYLAPLTAALKAGHVNTIVIEAGEESKNAASLQQILEEAAAFPLTRSDFIVYLGGGVVGDLAGFAAAVYMRGIRYIALPTTLLAMCDSAIGGKCAIDLKGGKNLAGAFYLPEAVIENVAYLKTLPKREWGSGLAEIIKYGFIKDEEILKLLENENAEEIAENLIARSAQIKTLITSRDFTDKGERMLLNFGHTLAHAVETLENYSVHSHGEAVAIGMNFAAYVSYELGGEDVRARMKALCEKYRLPVSCELEAEDLAALMSRDKKNVSGKLNFVALKKAGEAYLYPTSAAQLKTFLKRWREETQ